MKRASGKPKGKPRLRGIALEDEAALLRVHEGKEFAEIADELGMKDAAAAQRAVDRGVKRLPDYEPDLYRRMTTERLEHLYEMAHEKARDGDAAQIKTAASIAGQ
jgi:hypothetical protein